ncbi:MAG: carboxymuconolactone decarboxylase family protein [Phycisphaerae bacterium]
MPRGQPLIRQWNLLKTLQAHRFGIAADELAERLRISKRQVQRDLKVLRQVGFPVEHEDRDFGKRFWKLAPHFLEHEGLVLSLTETVSLYLARQMLSPLAGTPFGDGVLDAKTKELATLAISIAVRCDYCIALHVTNCLKAGATREEIMDICGVALAMGGGPSYTYAAFVLECLDASEASE